MPSIVTHHTFAQEVLKKIPDINVNNELYNVYAQSFDYFFYYNFFDLKNGDRVRSFGHKCHGSNTQLYFINLVKNIKEMHLENNQEALAYLYGSITHFVLDSTCHPFVYYKAGCFHKNDKSTYKYRGMHTKIEKHIDAFFSKQYFKKMIYKLNIRKEIIGNAKFSDTLIQLMDKTFSDTYNTLDMGKYYVKSYNFSKKVFTFIIQDKKGIKKKIYKFIDLFNKKGTKLEYYSSYIRNEDINFLNIQRKEWHHPCTNKRLNDSFIDLYNKSINKAVNIINELDSILNDRTDIKKVEKIIDNYSYRTGLPLDKNKEIKYFEY